jgi:EpsD family peptidyl-prolyl cis-trans isomerase
MTQFPLASCLRRQSLWLVLCFAALAGALSGCGQASSKTSQVAASVNSDEISEHQLQMAMAQSRRLETGDDKRSATLERLIDRQLAVQQALKQTMDRKPGIMMQLEEARRDILASAFAYELSSKVAPVLEQDVWEYYELHPELFAQRQIYIVREVVVGPDNSLLPELQMRLNKKEDLTSVVTWLKSSKSNYNDQIIARSAEQLPLEILPALAKVKAGEVIAFRMSGGLVVYQLLTAHSAPLTMEQANPMVIDHLKRQAEVEAVRAAVAKLKEDAKISRSNAAL